MPTFDFDGFAKEMSKLPERQVKAAIRGLQAGAMHGKAVVKDKSPVGVTGLMKKPWKNQNLPDGAILYNDAPYAGVVEQGSRPFWISPAGMEELIHWVWHMRGKLNMGAGRGLALKSGKNSSRAVKGGNAMFMAVLRVARAIAFHFAQYGIKPQFPLKNSLPELGAIAVRETESAIRQELARA